ncbi:cinnamyl-alcohol dehydrogenase family protein [Striga asiatica]|uniref:Cinnamyl-alcohol dehydrogenase family protein n=1 Tax=Striga asiatica TaxID=4170 RepID=A0A5A7QQB9_STRAF|nr:cinnamyl-alcohol dehydrogenase family protein [Striga asiatica]
MIKHPVKAFGWAARDTSGVFSPFKFSRRETGEHDVECNIENSPTYAFLYVRTITYGGYSDIMVADEHFVIRWPKNLPLDIGAPLLCAGITTYSPLRHFGMDKPGLNVGVVGLGGLGHVAVKFGKAFGTKVTVISTSLSKKKEAIENLGADEFLVSHDPDEMQAAKGTLDGIIDTVSVDHPIPPLLSLLKPNGTLIMVGVPAKPLEIPVMPLIMGRKGVFGSAIGGIKETQEMIDFAAEHNILPNVEIISWITSTLLWNVSSCLTLKHPVKAFGWAARDTSGVFSPFKFSRRETGEHDVEFKVMYCGVCHSDLHMAKNEWGYTQYPIVPGQCNQCANGLENYCSKAIQTYSQTYVDGTITYGGYSDIMVADEHFVIRWPENLPLDIGAPLLCAGITTYSPLRYFGLDKPGLNVGVVGLGGLGHVAVKFAKAFGTKVTVISTSLSKKKEAIENLGADEFLVSRDPDQMKAAEGTLDGIIDTVSADHPIPPLLSLLKPNGTLIMVGAPAKPLEIPVMPLIMGRKGMFGSAIGGIKETQEMIDFAAEHNILPDVEMISMDYINTAMERLLKSDVKYRFVIDIAKSLKPE